MVTIGCQKCGTTSLHHYLKAHPEIGVSRYKETRFFAVSGDPRLGEAGKWHRGVDWYRRQFPSDKPVLVEGFGGGYTDYPRVLGVPQRIHSVIPEARFLMLVRHPVERLISHWMHARSNSQEYRSVEDATAQLDDNVYIDRGRYRMQLEPYLEYFEHSRFLIIDHRDFLRHRRETMARVFAFLGVDAGFWSESYETEYHTSDRKRRNNRLGMIAQRAIGDRLFRHLRDRQRHLFKYAYTPVSSRIARPELSAPHRRRLIEVFRDDIAGLEAFTDRSFAHWLR